MEYLHGGDIYTHQGMIDFSVNVHPLGPSEAVKAAACNAIEQIGAYPDSQCRELRKLLANHLDINEEWLVFGNGAADLIFSLVFAEKPQKALLTAPSFAEYKQALDAVGCEVSYYYLKEEENFCLGRDYLACLTEEIDMIFLCTPDNPTGNVIEADLLREIAATCERLNIRMVLDQCFYEFLEESSNVLGAGEVQNFPHVMILRAFTKMYAIPGLRLGYAITADPALLEQLAKVRQPWSVSTPAQAAGIAALREPERVETAKHYIIEERKIMEAEFQRIGLKYFPSSANYILCKSEHDLFSRLKEKNILIRDCSNYEGLKKGFYRIAIRSKHENALLIKALNEICGNVVR